MNPAKRKWWLPPMLAVALASCGGGGGGGSGSGPPPVAVSLSPATADVFVGGIVQFTATVSNATDATVTWTVSNVAGGNSTVGKISSSGLYVAPPIAPNPATITVTAVSKADTTKSASATITVMAFSSAALNGQYAFSVASSTIVSFLFAVGSFTADGTGNITSGVEDVNGAPPSVTFTGSYSITPDGRGSATLSSSMGRTDFRFVVVSASEALIIQFDNSFDEGAGLIVKQDPSAFARSSFKGSYAFRYTGLGLNGGLGAAGTFTADGKGGIAAGAEDVNDGGTVSANASFTGSYSSIDSNGRGTATLGTAQVAFYMVSASRLMFVSLDPLSSFAGEAEAQTFAGGSTSFSSASLSGDYTFSASGLNTLSLDTVASAGRFTADGKGALTQGLEDENNAGSVASSVAFKGTYNISSSGRGAVVLTGGAAAGTFTFYMVSAKRALFVETDSGSSATGVADGETGGPFTTPSVVGGFGFLLTGESLSTAGERETSGQITADGAGKIIAGAEDVNDSSTLSPGVAINGTYTLSNDRGTAAIQTAGGTAHLVFYVTSASELKFVGVDPSVVLAGVAKHF